MAIKKSQLYSSIWESCDELRGGMDASQYKDYVLVLLFVRYVSDKYVGKKNAEVVVPKGGGFADLVALKGKTGIGDGINKVLRKLAEANGLGGIFDNADFNEPEKLGSGKDMVDRLSKLVAIFENPDLDFSKNRAEGDDLLGDAYEFLMKHFAVESGKSKGQFYTPAEVSRIIAKVIGAQNATGTTQTVYDPTCGSGSLLLKVAGETPKGISIYGQELDNATANLATLNMWLHNQPTAVIKKGQSTLSSPLFIENGGALKTFNYVVANPPFSYKAWRTGFNPETDQFDRFTGYGIPPAKNGDFAFLLHILRSMKSTGKGAIILPHGVLFRGNGESAIRTNVIKRGYIKGIIGLPVNLFYGTGIPACIIVLDKAEAANRGGIFMINASKGFVKDGNKNRLLERDIKKIVDTFETQQEIPKYSRFVTNEEIQKNNYNLNIPRYIDAQEVDDLQDIEGHLKGGIPNADINALESYWRVCPTLKSVIFKSSARKGYSEVAIPIEKIGEVILSHKEFSTFRSSVLRKFGVWRKETITTLEGISAADHPKGIIELIANDILHAFAGGRLLDTYDIYQHLMAYWAETMQDDVYILTVDGWKAGKEIFRLQKNSKKGKKVIEGLVGLEGRLIPTSLVIDTYFASEQKTLDHLNARLEQVDLEMDEMLNEHGSEEGLMSEVVDGDKITKGALEKRMREIKGDKDFFDEYAVLKKYAGFFEQEIKLRNAIKHGEKELEQKLIAKYPKLTLEEVKVLVVECKWMDSLEAAMRGEIDRLSRQLAGRVKELAERYRMPLPKLVKQTETLSAKVVGHLKTMGFNL